MIFRYSQCMFDINWGMTTWPMISLNISMAEMRYNVFFMALWYLYISVITLFFELSRIKSAQLHRIMHILPSLKAFQICIDGHQKTPKHSLCWIISMKYSWGSWNLLMYSQTPHPSCIAAGWHLLLLSIKNLREIPTQV